MTNETFGKLFVKVATQDKAARVLSGFIAFNKQAAAQRKQYVKDTVYGIMQKQAVDATGVIKAPSKVGQIARGVGKGLAGAAMSIPSVNKAVNDVKGAVNAGKNMANAVTNPRGTDTDANTWAPQLAAQSLDPNINSYAARTMREYMPAGLAEPVGDVRSVEDSAKNYINAEQAAQAAAQAHVQNTANVGAKYADKVNALINRLRGR